MTRMDCVPLVDDFPDAKCCVHVPRVHRERRISNKGWKWKRMDTVVTLFVIPIVLQVKLIFTYRDFSRMLRLRRLDHPCKKGKRVAWWWLGE